MLSYSREVSSVKCVIAMNLAGIVRLHQFGNVPKQTRLLEMMVLVGTLGMTKLVKQTQNGYVAFVSS